MGHNNYNIAEAIVNAIKAAIPAAYKKPFKCKEYATAMRAQLIANGTAKPKCFLAKVVREDGRRAYEVPLWHNGAEIAENGIHIFTPVNNKVFDNINHNGTNFDIVEYTNLFDTRAGFKIQFREILEGEDILKINE